MESLSKAQNGEEFKFKIERLSSVVADLPGAKEVLSGVKQVNGNVEGAEERLESRKASARAVHLSPWEGESWLALELSSEKECDI